MQPLNKVRFWTMGYDLFHHQEKKQRPKEEGKKKKKAEGKNAIGKEQVCKFTLIDWWSLI